MRLVENGFRLLDSRGTNQVLTANAVDSTVRAQLPAHVPDGSYVISWRVVSADSHPISGGLTLSIGKPSTTPVANASIAGGSGPISWLYVLTQALGYLGLLTIVGMTIFRFGIVRKRNRPDRVRTGILRGAGIVSVVAYLLTLPLSVIRQQGSGWAAFAQSGTWDKGFDSASGSRWPW